MDQAMRNAFLRDVDRDIGVYVREMQQHAPVSAEAVYMFLSRTRGRRVDLDLVRDRLAYLEDLGDLRSNREWQDGEVKHWQITAQGRDRLDGAIPPPNWSAH